MKKLAVVLITSLAFTAPALACPDMEGHGDNTPKTAEKAKDAPKKDATKAKEAPKKAEDTKTAKPAEKTPTKPADKVSSK